jgi:hypothetical protein
MKPFHCSGNSSSFQIELIILDFILHTYLPVEMEECSETSAYKNSDAGELPR